MGGKRQAAAELFVMASTDGIVASVQSIFMYVMAVGIWSCIELGTCTRYSLLTH